MKEVRGLVRTALMLLLASAAFDAFSQVSPPPDEPEEMTITGRRMLRLQMEAAERNAYELFNKFNDDKRFEISCSAHAATGSHFRNQFCQPEFELQAMRDHGRAVWADFEGQQQPLPYTPMITHVPEAAAIDAQQGEYRRKMKQVAEEHPEFLEALIHYTETRAQYEKSAPAE